MVREKDNPCSYLRLSCKNRGANYKPFKTEINKNADLKVLYI
jgi:hypothetical protein